jgi:hypothetical protein
MFKVGDKARQLTISKYGNGNIGDTVVIEQTDFCCSDGTHTIVARSVEGGTNMMFRPTDLAPLYEDPTVEIAELRNELARLLDRIDSLAARVIVPVAEPIPTLPTLQEIRDKAVAEAKKDVEDILAIGRDDYRLLEGSPFRGKFYDADFIVNKEKRTVVALVYHLDGFVAKPYPRKEPKPIAKGIAKCDPTDTFNVHLGKAIALRRALELEVPEEYLKAPQPTEIRVGDVIERKGTGLSSRLRTVTEICDRSNVDLFYRTKEGQEQCLGVTDADNVKRIVDDSREAL